MPELFQVFSSPPTYACLGLTLMLLKRSSIPHTHDGPHPSVFIEDLLPYDADDDDLYGNSDDISALASYLYGGDLQSNVIRVPRAADTNVRVPRADDDISQEDAVKALNDDAHMNALGDNLERRSKVPRAA